MRKGQRRRGGTRRREAISAINMTPFIDVMLVLLVVFMVALPQSWNVENFGSGSEQPPPPPSKPEPRTLVTVKADKSVEVSRGETRASRPMVGQVVMALREVGLPEDGKVYVKGEDCTPYEKPFQVLTELRAAGLKPVIVTKAPIPKEAVAGSKPVCPIDPTR